MINFNELDSEVGEWPISLKIIAAALLCIAVAGGGHWLVIKGKLARLVALESKESQLKTTFEAKQAKAANLDAYQQQLEEVRNSLDAMLRQLPSKTEVADLLVDISQTGLSSGLEFKLFKPGPETQANFYVVLPIQIRVVGNYHQFGEFVSKIAALPRIVTLHDLSITHRAKGALVMNITAKTYRYLAENKRRTAAKK